MCFVVSVYSEFAVSLSPVCPVLDEYLHVSAYTHVCLHVQQTADAFDWRNSAKCLECA